MTKKFQLYLTNTQTGPFKIPFKRGTPKELQALVNGVINVGKKAIIPSNISEFIDMDRIERDKMLGHVKYKVREVSDIPSKAKLVKKAKKVVKPKEETKTYKKNGKKGGN